MLKKYVNFSLVLLIKSLLIKKACINEYMKRLQFSGYDKEFRYDTYNSATKAHHKLKEGSSNGIRLIKDQRPGEEKNENSRKK